MATRSRSAKDADLGNALYQSRFKGTMPMVATSQPQAAPAPLVGTMEAVESGLLGAPPGAAGGVGDVGSDAWAFNTGGPGASLWRAIASGGVYNALDWAGKHPNVLSGGNDEVMAYAKKKGAI